MPETVLTRYETALVTRLETSSLARFKTKVPHPLILGKTRWSAVPLTDKKDYVAAMTLYTVGYEGCDIEEFVKFLQKKKISVIADLRKNPVSRKRGFSKNKLAEQLGLKKINYVHYKTLGTPTAWRKLESAGRMTREKMFELYVREVLPKASEEIELLRNLLANQSTAILCYEADAIDCHRNYVADELVRLEKRKLKVVHLLPKPELVEEA
jgi:uncharacterized protein (DUF488 family)